MAKSKNAPKVLPELDDIREAMQQAIADQLEPAVSASGNTYFTVPARQIQMAVKGVIGTFACSWFNLRDGQLVEAATTETAKAAVAKLTPEQRRALLAEYADEI